MNRRLRLVISPFLAFSVAASPLLAQLPTQRATYGYQEYPRTGERYITDEFGVVRMWVNVWGHVQKPGSYLAYDGVDMAALLSLSGGPKPGADLRKVRLFRENPDGNGKQMYVIDLEKFLKTGDRSDFVEVLPNDTYVVPQTVASYVLSHAGLANTIFSIFNLYLQILIWRNQLRS